jgi:hypothetical protein
MRSAIDTSTKYVGVIAGAPARLLRLEGTALLAGSPLAHAPAGPWWLVPLTFLLPDLSETGYLFGTKAGASSCNLAHTTPLPGVLVAVG